MLLIGFQNLGQHDIQTKYPDKFNIIEQSNYSLDKDGIISFIQDIKTAVTIYDTVYINYSLEVITCLQALKIAFYIVYRETNEDRVTAVKQMDCEKIIITDLHTLEQYLINEFNWNGKDEQIVGDVEKDEKNEQTKEVIEKEVNPVEVSQPTEENQLLEQSGGMNLVHSKTKLSLAELIQEDVDITESDVREFKSITNKLKMGMLLQAKSNLKRVLKLSDILDKLYDKLLDRVANSLDTCDTASLMYTTEYISKALTDTNNFIMSLINNEKIQNFFIIDNSNVVNINDSRIDLDKRERIRRAAEIVINNLDYFVEGDYTKIVNPNDSTTEFTEAIEGEQNVQNKSESV